MELPGWGPDDWVKPGSCLAKVCGLEGHICRGFDSRLREGLCKITQAINDTVRKHSDESKDGNGIDCRVPRRN